MAPICSNCGGNEFVWVNDLKTGTIGRGTLSIRSGGELSLGTRLCRGCGHADLFLKDPSILKMPHTWRPGEFVPIPARPAAPAPSHVPAPVAPAAPPPPPSPPAPVAAPPPAPTPPSVEPTPAPAVADPGPDTPADAASVPPKPAARKRSAKSKSPPPAERSGEP